MSSRAGAGVPRGGATPPGGCTARAGRAARGARRPRRPAGPAAAGGRGDEGPDGAQRGARRLGGARGTGGTATGARGAGGARRGPDEAEGRAPAVEEALAGAARAEPGSRDGASLGVDLSDPVVSESLRDVGAAASALARLAGLPAPSPEAVRAAALESFSGRGRASPVAPLSSALLEADETSMQREEDELHAYIDAVCAGLDPPIPEPVWADEATWGVGRRGAEPGRTAGEPRPPEEESSGPRPPVEGAGEPRLPAGVARTQRGLRAKVRQLARVLWLSESYEEAARDAKASDDFAIARRGGEGGEEGGLPATETSFASLSPPASSARNPAQPRPPLPPPSVSPPLPPLAPSPAAFYGPGTSPDPFEDPRYDEPTASVPAPALPPAELRAARAAERALFLVGRATADEAPPEAGVAALSAAGMLDECVAMADPLGGVVRGAESVLAHLRALGAGGARTEPGGLFLASLTMPSDEEPHPDYEILCDLYVHVPIPAWLGARDLLCDEDADGERVEEDEGGRTPAPWPLEPLFDAAKRKLLERWGVGWGVRRQQRRGGVEKELPGWQGAGDPLPGATAARGAGAPAPNPAFVEDASAAGKTRRIHRPASDRVRGRIASDPSPSKQPRGPLPPEGVHARLRPRGRRDAAASRAWLGPAAGRPGHVTVTALDGWLERARVPPHAPTYYPAKAGARGVPCVRDAPLPPLSRGRLVRPLRPGAPPADAGLWLGGAELARRRPAAVLEFARPPTDRSDGSGAPGGRAADADGGGEGAFEAPRCRDDLLPRARWVPPEAFLPVAPSRRVSSRAAVPARARSTYASLTARRSLSPWRTWVAEGAQDRRWDPRCRGSIADDALAFAWGGGWGDGGAEADGGERKRGDGESGGVGAGAGSRGGEAAGRPPSPAADGASAPPKGNSSSSALPRGQTRNSSSPPASSPALPPLLYPHATRPAWPSPPSRAESARAQAARLAEVARSGVRAFASLLARLPIPGRRQDTNNAPDEGSAWLSGRVFTLCWTMRFRVNGRVGLVDAMSVSWGSLAGQALREPRDAVEALVSSSGMTHALLGKAQRHRPRESAERGGNEARPGDRDGRDGDGRGIEGRGGDDLVGDDDGAATDAAARGESSSDELCELEGPPSWTRLEEEQDPERGWLATLLREEDEEDASRDAAWRLENGPEDEEDGGRGRREGGGGRIGETGDTPPDSARAPHAAARARMRAAFARVAERLEALGDEDETKLEAEDIWRCREPGPGTRGGKATGRKGDREGEGESKRQTWWRRFILDAFR